MADKKLRLWRVDAGGNRHPIDFFVNEKLEIQKILSGDQNLKVEELMAGRMGQTVSASDPDVPGRVLLFDENYECWFAECAELRAAYFKELRALEAEAAERGVPCANCDIGDIKRKYISKMRALNAPLYPNGPNVGYQQSP